MVAAGAVACLLGASAAYLALQPELEAQFHGGVLEEDRAWVFWHNAWVAARTFAFVAPMVFALIGPLPAALHRLWCRVRG